MTINITDNIYTFPVRLPHNPLQYVNCYVIKATDGGRSLLIDTGFNRPDCLKMLLEGMKSLDLCPENTDVFITHFHSDHSGNLGALYDMGYPIVLGRIELVEFDRSVWPRVPNRFSHEGMPDNIVSTFYDNPSMRYMPTDFVPSRLVEDGEVLCYGGHRLKCIHTPGHSMGHMCLYDEDNRIFFCGDHVLFDITPNITCRCERRDILSIYLSSLEKIREYRPELVLPGHRRYGELNMHHRIDEIIDHHTARLNEALQIVRDCPGLTGYEVSGRMAWRISSGGWSKFPDNQKWFAMGEGLAHLDHLMDAGLVAQSENTEGKFIYNLTDRS